MRLCEHRLDIVKQALHSNPALCKDTAKVVSHINCLSEDGL